MDTVLDFLALLCQSLLLAKRSPGGDTFLPVLLPRLHVLLGDLVSCRLLFSFVPFLALTGSLKSLKEVLALFDFLEELLTHVLYFKVEGLFGKCLKTHGLSPLVLLCSLALNPFSCFAHDPLVHPTLLGIHQSLVGLLEQVKSIGGLVVMTAFVRMHKNGQHAELLLYLRFARLRPNLKDVIWIDKGMVEQSVKLVILVELRVFLGQLTHLKHDLLKLFFHLLLFLHFLT